MHLQGFWFVYIEIKGKNICGLLVGRPLMSAMMLFTERKIMSIIYLQTDLDTVQRALRS